MKNSLLVLNYYVYKYVATFKVMGVCFLVFMTSPLFLVLYVFFVHCSTYSQFFLGIFGFVFLFIVAISSLLGIQLITFSLVKQVASLWDQYAAFTKTSAKQLGYTIEEDDIIEDPCHVSNTEQGSEDEMIKNTV